MHPAFSVIFLTTLIGTGQGLFLALYTGQVYAFFHLLSEQASKGFYLGGSLIALSLLIAGLIASFFHLGHPERAWRSAAKWRTSWLSREVLALPAFMGMVLLYGAAHWLDWNQPLVTIGTLTLSATMVFGALGTVLCFVLFVCTAMIYACLKFLQEWHSPLTVINYLLLGSASGFTLATAYSVYAAPELMGFYGKWAIIITLLAMVTRVASLMRNCKLKPKSTLQSAIGVRHNKIVQQAQGFMGGSFNTREFFHGKSKILLRSVKWVFLITVFVLPLLLLAGGLSTSVTVLLSAAFLVQYAGLLAERWFFFAQANHPQNLYYQAIS
ncbi:MAG: dimethyl sulfoxide reductase anchor subunit [Betaproteobacteria bacterium]|nr:dimethyl sulfoxide reductase anchor subunit [Betaproteobacteria bacterium]